MGSGNKTEITHLMLAMVLSFIIRNIVQASVAQLAGVLSPHKPKGRRFNSCLEHMPRLLVSSQSGRVREATD